MRLTWGADRMADRNSDVGGMAPGSLSGEATEIFQEGLRLPAVKLISEGKASQANVLRNITDFISAEAGNPNNIIFKKIPRDITRF